MTVYTNIGGRKTIRNALLTYARNIQNLNIASAFFSADSDLLEIAKRGININLVIRLNEGTSIAALKSIVNHNRINIRYYTDISFHPKLYIFGDQLALLGSANATNAGINSNSEASVTIEQQDEDFDELVSLFSSYWDNAMPLTEEIIKDVESCFTKHTSAQTALEKDIEKRIGKISPPSNVVVRETKKPKQTYVEDYERRYQTFISSFDRIKEIYKSYGKRKPEAESLPLRIEIDQFLNFIRDQYTKGDSYNEEPIRSGDDLKIFVTNTIDDWISADFRWLEHVVTNYPIINNKFSSAELIKKMSLDDMFDTLAICHAFREQLRHHRGGLETFKKAFVADNDEEQVKETISYLLHEKKDRFTMRMAECIFGPYKLNHMGRSSVQELLGWVNNEDIPICNNRTLRALRYLGAIEGTY